VPDYRNSPDPPAWVYKRDGRLVPFETDKICHSLFVATESLGHPDPFMARELADGVLHFLSADVDGGIPTTAQVGDTVVKVIRELGQPELAQAYSHSRDRLEQTTDRLDHLGVFRSAKISEQVTVRLGPLRSQLESWSRSDRFPASLIWNAGKFCLAEYAAEVVYSRDVLAAQKDGWLTLGAPEASFELEAALCRVPPALTVASEVLSARHLAGRFVAISGLEQAATAVGPSVENGAARFLEELRLGLAAAGLTAIVNLNTPDQEVDVGSHAGSLFARAGSAVERVDRLSGAILEQASKEENGAVRIVWHVRNRAFAGGNERQLHDPIRRVRHGAPLTFAFDRPGAPTFVGEGMDSDHPAVLLSVALHLPRLARERRHIAASTGILDRLGSLARLATSAARQKREFLRRHSSRRDLWSRGFLLDRARLVIIPVGLDAVVRESIGAGICKDSSAQKFGVQILERLWEALRVEGKSLNLNTCMDSAPDFRCEIDAPATDLDSVDPREAAGVTTWDSDAPALAQIRAAGALHAVVGSGTAAVFTPEREPLPVDELVELLRYALERTQIQRLRFVRCGKTRQRLLPPWEA
jgi:ATP cone domain